MFNPRFSELLTSHEAAEYAGVHHATIRKAISAGQMRGARFGGHNEWVTSRKAVDEHYQRKTAAWLNMQKRHERAAKIRAANQCRRCNNYHTPKRLTAYYIDRDRTNFTPSNLIILCWPCYFFAMKHHHPNQMLLPGLDLPHWLKGG